MILSFLAGVFIASAIHFWVEDEVTAAAGALGIGVVLFAVSL